jgi:hypothetical protein
MEISELKQQLWNGKRAFVMNSSVVVIFFCVDLVVGFLVTIMWK